MHFVKSVENSGAEYENNRSMLHFLMLEEYAWVRLL